MPEERPSAGIAGAETAETAVPAEPMGDSDGISNDLVCRAEESHPFSNFVGDEDEISKLSGSQDEFILVEVLVDCHDVCEVDQAEVGKMETPMKKGHNLMLGFKASTNVPSFTDEELADSE
jgi:hypothetical protein